MAEEAKAVATEQIIVRIIKPGVWSKSLEKYLEIGAEHLVTGADVAYLVPRFAVVVSHVPSVNKPETKPEPEPAAAPVEAIVDSEANAQAAAQGPVRMTKWRSADKEGQD